MPNICINDVVLNTDALVLDKDGTLIDFHLIWSTRIETAAKAIVAHRQDSTQLLGHLYRCVGYDPARRQTLGQGPLATAPIHKLEIIVTGALYQWGIPWEDASQLATRHFTRLMSELPAANEIKPRGEILTTLQELHRGGIRLAVATTDNRAATEVCLEAIGIQNLINTLVCGDDENLPVKPDPAVLLVLAEQFGIPVKRLAMVGDTTSDLCMAKKAGAGYAIGIVGGAGEESELRAETKFLINSLEEIRVI